MVEDESSDAVLMLDLDKPVTLERRIRDLFDEVRRRDEAEGEVDGQGEAVGEVESAAVDGRAVRLGVGGGRVGAGRGGETAVDV